MNNKTSYVPSRAYTGECSQKSPDIIPNRISNTGNGEECDVKSEGVVNQEISDLQVEINRLKEVLGSIYSQIEQVSVPGLKAGAESKDVPEPYRPISPVAERIRATRSVIHEMVEKAQEVRSRLEV